MAYNIQHKTTGYEITFNYTHTTLDNIMALKKSITDRLSSVDIDVSVVRGDSDICMIINADNLEPLNTAIKKVQSMSEKYKLLVQVIYALSNQLIYLLDKEKHCFYNYTMEDVILINGGKTAFYILPHLLKTNYSPNKNYTYMTLYNFPEHQKNEFASPELFTLSTLPAKLPVSTIFWSMGMLIIRGILINMPIENFNNINPQQLLDQCDCIKGTRLFNMLTYCIKQNHRLRTINWGPLK
jgi:hypothetical protein